jgi:hypothetical protein
MNCATADHCERLPAARVRRLLRLARSVRVTNQILGVVHYEVLTRPSMGKYPYPVERGRRVGEEHHIETGGLVGVPGAGLLRVRRGPGLHATTNAFKYT